MSNNTSIPTNPATKIRDDVKARVLHPAYPEVVKCIEAQDLLILAGEITDEKRTSLAWVIEQLCIAESETDLDLINRAKSIKTAVGVFDGIVKNLERQAKASMHEEQTNLARLHVSKIAGEWMESWYSALEGFTVFMTWIQPSTLEEFGFAGFELTKPRGDKHQWAVLSLAELIERVQTEESILDNFAFRRALMSGMSRFYVWVFNALGRESDNVDLLDAADSLSLAVYGDSARLADRTNIRSDDQAETTKKLSDEVRQKKAARSAASKAERAKRQQPKGAKPQTYGKK